MWIDTVQREKLMSAENRPSFTIQRVSWVTVLLITYFLDYGQQLEISPIRAALNTSSGEGNNIIKEKF